MQYIFCIRHSQICAGGVPTHDSTATRCLITAACLSIGEITMFPFHLTRVRNYQQVYLHDSNNCLYITKSITLIHVSFVISSLFALRKNPDAFCQARDFCTLFFSYTLTLLLIGGRRFFTQPLFVVIFE